MGHMGSSWTEGQRKKTGSAIGGGGATTEETAREIMAWNRIALPPSVGDKEKTDCT